APPLRPPKIQKRFNTDGQKLGEFEGENFCPSASPAKRDYGVGSVSALPLARGKQNRKIFFSLIEKNFGGRRLKKCRENFSVLLAEAKRRRAETHQLNYRFSRSVRFRSEPPRARRVVSRGSVQKKLEFQPKGTAFVRRS
ncbi:MAG: hypothetical protein ABIJ60_00785, partial [Patescibacteria group bacterium]